MLIRQLHIDSNKINTNEFNTLAEINPQLIITFSSVESLVIGKINIKLTDYFSNSTVVGCTTAGEIYKDSVYDNTAVVTGIHFDNPDFQVKTSELPTMNASFDSGKKLAEELYDNSLRSAFVLGLGVNINGSALIDGLENIFKKNILITGGLAGDGGKFKQTYTFLNDQLFDNRNLGIGFYNTNINLSYGSAGGWQPFGPLRQITKSSMNILYEIDGKPALEVYKKYLGEFAEDLPASGLLFPFLLVGENDGGLVRTILGIDEKNGSLILAGDVEEYGFVKLMQAGTDSLVAGAQEAAKSILNKKLNDDTGLAILISCVGRKLVMGNRIDEEIDAINSMFDATINISGFYSYGEICPLKRSIDCKLHNQTMTITYITEK